MAAEPSTSGSIPEIGEFRECLRQMQADARQVVTETTFLEFTHDLEPDPTILALLENQPEFDQQIWTYLDNSVTTAKIDAGTKLLETNRSVFDSVETSYGIDRAVIAAVWGIETNFSTEMGRRLVLQTTATLACAGRRQAYFRKEFLAALEIAEHGDIDRDKFRGSWSGAFGGTQFMPTNLIKCGVDYDADGRRDIIGSSSDIIASTANALKTYGWIKGRPCFQEVSLAADFNFLEVSRHKTLSEWKQAGVSLISDRFDAVDNEQLRLSLPAGAQGPAFLLTRNFDAILQYNPAEAYAYAVCYLQHRLAGGDPIESPWPRSERPLSRSERRELQTLLSGRELMIGPIDGMIGGLTRAGISAFQARSGLKPDGFPSASVLDLLRHP